MGGSERRPTCDSGSEGAWRQIGVVVPVFQGEPTLDELHRRVTAQLTALTTDWEILYVDDGSRDRSWPMVEAFAALDPRVHAVKLVRNYGEHVAITAGLDHADADHTIIMACDLQDDPAAIPAIVEAARTTGADLVLTRRMQRQDPLLKRAAGADLLRRRAVLRQGALRPPGRQLSLPVAAGRALLPRVS